MQIVLNLQGHRLLAGIRQTLSSGSKEVDEIKLEVDETWKGFGKIAVFCVEKKCQYTVVDEVTQTAKIPAEVLRNEAVITIGIVGFKDEAVMTSTLVAYQVEKGSVVTIEDPEPSIYVEILSRYADLATRLNNIIANAGDLTNNAELIDARVGGDDVVYDTLGEAIREQFKKAGSKIEVDDTLTTRGKAADAKATGEAISEIVSDGINIFNSSKVEKSGDGDLDANNGDVISGTKYVSKLIRNLEIGKTYTFSRETGYVALYFYESSGKYSGKNIIIPGGVEKYKSFICEYPYYRILAYNDFNKSQIQITRGEYTGYHEYDRQLAENIRIKDRNIVDHLLGEKNITNKNIKDYEIASQKLNFTKQTYNVLNPLECEAGIINTHGGISSNSDFATTDFIEISEDTKIKTNKNIYQIAFYNEDKGFIQKTNAPLGLKEYIVQDASYIRLSFNTIIEEMKNTMVYFGEEEKAFIPYYVISSEYIEKEKTNFPKEIKIVLPEQIVLVEGVKIAINHQSVIRNFDAQRAVRSGYIIGNHFKTYGQKTILEGAIQPDGSVIFESVIDYQFAKNIRKQFKIVNVEKNTGSGLNKKILFIGDSKTDANQYTQYLLDMFESDEMNIELIGTRGTGTNKHEGRSGWSAENYVENNAWRGVIEESPFWNPNTEQFDFAYYMMHNKYNSLDYVFINLGTNDSYTNFISYYHKMIDGIKKYNSEIVVGLCTPSPFATFGGYSHRDNDNQTFNMIEAILDEFDNEECRKNKIFVIPTHVNIDTYYDFAWDDIKVNQKSNATYRVCKDQIHEVNGYSHLSDVIFCYIKYFSTLG